VHTQTEEINRHAFAVLIGRKLTPTAATLRVISLSYARIVLAAHGSYL